MKTNVKSVQRKMIMKCRSMLMLIFACAIIACSTDDDSSSSNDGLVGSPGNPRFNLQFSNADNVDLDLYVKSPNGITVYYGNTNADGGALDVDCQCSLCPQGANENIFWESGSAPSGVYEYWVEYFGDCGGSSSSSSFTLKVLRNSEVVTTKTGSLSGGQSPTYTYTHN